MWSSGLHMAHFTLRPKSYYDHVDQFQKTLINFPSWANRPYQGPLALLSTYTDFSSLNGEPFMDNICEATTMRMLISQNLIWMSAKQEGELVSFFFTQSLWAEKCDFAGYRMIGCNLRITFSPMVRSREFSLHISLAHAMKKSVLQTFCSAYSLPQVYGQIKWLVEAGHYSTQAHLSGCLRWRFLIAKYHMYGFTVPFSKIATDDVEPV